MSASPYQREQGSLIESKKQIHLNALLIALQYIDDLINSSQDGYVTNDIMQTHKLPKLENIYSINELRYHFQQLQMNKLYDQLQERELNNYQKIMDIMCEILQNDVYYQWFTVRIDEDVHQAYNYYQTIRFGMCFTFIAARLHANLLSNIDLPMLDDTRGFSFVQINASNYGGLQDEESMIKKANVLIQRAEMHEVDILGSTAYNLLKEKPMHYLSVQECLRDFLLIGMNCKIYNEKQLELCNIADQYTQLVVKLFEERFEKTFNLPLIHNQSVTDLIELQKRMCIIDDDE